MDLNTNDLTPAPWPVLATHCPKGLLVGFAATQRPLDADIAKILQDNLWDLYIEDDAQSAAEAHPQR